MIEVLVSDLPEIYQPIYGFPELSGQASRPCLDRFESIARIYDAMQRLLGRPLNVLDLGCAQGYFSLSLAERGAHVHGIDYLDKNIAVCNALAQSNPHLNASFEIGRVEDVIEHLKAGCYDLVLGLSVFHHIVHEKGVEAVKGLLDHAANRCGVLIVELALHEEPLYWAPSQPTDPRTLLDTIAFVHEVTQHATHLAPIPRPLFVASNRYWILEDHAEPFDSWSTDPHALAHGVHGGSRRYFFSANCILKLYQFDHPCGGHNKPDFEREVKFLRNPSSRFLVPKIIVQGERTTDAWLAMERLPGRLLLDLIKERVDFNAHSVLLSVLGQLAELEKVGLYHNDVRAWNVLVAEDGNCHLIDYGSISNLAQDCVWPRNIFLSFFIFVQELATGVVDDPEPLRTISISPYCLPSPYRNWAASLWHRPFSEWSFALMLQTLLETPFDGLDAPLEKPIEAWMKATEDAIQIQKIYFNNFQKQSSADKEQYQKMLKNLVDSQSKNFGLLDESIKRLEEKLARKISSLDTLESQFAWSQKNLLSIDQEKSKLQACAQDAEDRIRSIQSSLAETQKNLDAARQELHEVHQANHHHWQLAETRQKNLDAVYRSWSWRVTAPMRWGGAIVLRPMATARTFANWVICNGIETFQRPLSKLIAYVLRRPQLSYRINQMLLRYPALHQQLVGVARRAGVVAAVQPTHSVHTISTAGFVTPELENLTPRARQIYADLKKAIENNKGAD